MSLRLPWYIAQTQTAVDLFLSRYPCLSKSAASTECAVPVEDILLEFQLDAEKKIDTYFNLEQSSRLQDSFSFFGSKLATCALFSVRRDEFWRWIFSDKILPVTEDIECMYSEEGQPSRATLFNRIDLLTLYRKFGEKATSECANLGKCSNIFTQLGIMCLGSFLKARVARQQFDLAACVNPNISDKFGLPFTIREAVGSGAFGTVFRITFDNNPGSQAALKLNRLSPSPGFEFQSMHRDIQGMKLANTGEFEFLPRLIDTVCYTSDLSTIHPIRIGFQYYPYPGVIMEYIKAVHPQDNIQTGYIKAIYSHLSKEDQNKQLCLYLQAMEMMKRLLRVTPPENSLGIEEPLVLEDFHVGNILLIPGFENVMLPSNGSMECAQVKLVDTGSLNTLSGHLEPTEFSSQFPRELRREQPRVFLCWYLEVFHARFFRNRKFILSGRNLEIVKEAISDILRYADCSGELSYLLVLKGPLHQLFLDVKSRKAKVGINPLFDFDYLNV
jgi:hypothetical protein